MSTGGSGGAKGTGGAGSGGTGAASGAVCPGVAPWPATIAVCRIPSDCPRPQPTCQPTSAADACTSYCDPDPPAKCSADSNCGAGNVCVAQYTQCCDRPGRACAAACTETSCAADERCAPSGHCEPKPCTAGYTCPSDARCSGDASVGTSDPHGCVPLLCTEGYVCPSYATCISNVSFGGSPDTHDCVVVTCTGMPCPANSVCGLVKGSYRCVVKSCLTDGDCDCGVCLGAGATQGSCANRLNVCGVVAQGGASGGGGTGAGGVTGSGGRGVDSGMGVDGG